MFGATNQYRKEIGAILASFFVLSQLLGSFVFGLAPVHAQAGQSGVACQGLVDIVMVLDNSGSIDSTELADLQTAANDLVDSFTYDATNGTIMGITRFRGSSASVAAMTVSTPTLHAGINGLVQGGPDLTSGTNIVAGINGGSAQFATGLGDRDGTPPPDAPNIMIFITDGDDTATNSDATIAATSAASAADEIFAIGVGGAVQLTTLQAIAKPSDSAHVYDVADFDPDLLGLVEEIALAACPDDWGDLPEAGTSYPTTGSDAPRHVIGDLYLGQAIDDDLGGNPTANSDGDNLTDIDDEDGIVLTGSQWVPGATVGIEATVHGDDGYLVGWFDWNQNGVLTDAGDEYVPGFGFFARIRVFQGPVPVEPLEPTGRALNGEVEDYRWPFSPTAITLRSVEIVNTPGEWLLVGAAVLMLLVATTLVIFGQRRRLTR